MRTRLATLAVAALALGLLAPTTAGPDADDRCADVEFASSKNVWHNNAVETADDVDWFLFHLNARRTVSLTLGGLPVDLDLALYGECGDLLATSRREHRKFEDIVRRLDAGLYRAKVTNPDGIITSDEYFLRFRVVEEEAVPVLTGRSWVEFGYTSYETFVGEIINNIHRPIRDISVSVLYYRNNRVVGGGSYQFDTDSLAPLGRLPFKVRVARPEPSGRAVMTVDWRATERAPARFTIVNFAPYDYGSGVDYSGTVTNDNAQPTRTSIVATLYGRRGQVINMERTDLGRLEPGETSNWTTSFMGEHAAGRNGRAIAASGRRL